MTHPYQEIFHEMGVEHPATTAHLKERAVLYGVGRTSALLDRAYGSMCRQAGLSAAGSQQRFYQGCDPDNGICEHDCAGGAIALEQGPVQRHVASSALD